MGAERLQRLADLRQDFDQVFAMPQRLGGEDDEGLIVLSLGEESVALRLSELKGLHALPPLMPLPEPSRGLLGLAGLRGQVLPVYDLARLLGMGSGPSPRWMVLCGDDPVGLAFHELKGHFRVAPSQILPAGSRDLRWAAGVLHLHGVPSTLLHLPPIIAVARHPSETSQRTVNS